MKKRKCYWNCGRPTENRTGICDDCWRDRERIHAERKAKEAAAEVSEPQKAALEKARQEKARKRPVELPQA